MRAGLIAAVALLVAAPTAHAQDAARLPLGSTMRELVAAPDGGAWITYAPASGRDRIGRLSPDGRLRTVAGGTLLGGTLGLDGHAWFRTARARARARGRRPAPHARDVPAPPDRPVRDRDGRDVVGAVVRRPDGAHRARGVRLLHAGAAAGGVHAPGTEQSELHEMVRASDGAMWITDFGCDRLLRVTPEATTAIADARDASPR